MTYMGMCNMKNNISPFFFKHHAIGAVMEVKTMGKIRVSFRLVRNSINCIP